MTPKDCIGSPSGRRKVADDVADLVLPQRSGPLVYLGTGGFDLAPYVGLTLGGTFHVLGPQVAGILDRFFELYRGFAADSAVWLFFMVFFLISFTI